MEFTLFDELTGEVVNSGHAHEDVAKQQGRPGCKLILGKYTDGATHKIDVRTGKRVAIDRPLGLKLFDIHRNRQSEMTREIEFEGHRIGVSDGDMRGWFEVAEIFRVLAPASYDIETNTGKLTVTAAEWLALYSRILIHRQAIINRGFDLARDETEKHMRRARISAKPSAPTNPQTIRTGD